jgi:hypothetical protein
MAGRFSWIDYLNEVFEVIKLHISRLLKSYIIPSIQSECMIGEGIGAIGY